MAILKPGPCSKDGQQYPVDESIFTCHATGFSYTYLVDNTYIYPK